MEVESPGQRTGRRFAGGLAAELGSYALGILLAPLFALAFLVLVETFGPMFPHWVWGRH